MCQNCGCEHGDIHEHHHHHSHDHQHNHDYNHEHHHHDHHEHGHEKRIMLEQDVLEKNKVLACSARQKLEDSDSTLINMISSPGSGKTSLLEALIPKMKRKCYVIEGDQQTSNDSERLKRLDISSVQINTGNGCHLDAQMVEEGLQQLKPLNNSLIFIENVGNLVCPSLFDLGENLRIVVISTTEGEDKPLKYPNAFLFANVCIINKIDLLPFLKFDIDALLKNINAVNPNMLIFRTSATTGEGIPEIVDWLEHK